MTAESCDGGSPWKCNLATVNAAFSLDRQGVPIAGLSDQTVLEMNRQLQDATNKGKEETLLKAWEKQRQASNQA